MIFLQWIESMRLRIWLPFLFVFLMVGILGPSPASAKDQFVAVVITGDLPRYREAHEAFVKVLEAGGLDRSKVQIYVQTPNPDRMSWINSIRKAVGVGADLIVTYGAPVTLTAKKEAKGIPVLFADVYDPVGTGIVKALAVPGGEITGVSGKTPLVTLIKNYVEVKGTRNVGVLYSADDLGSVRQVEELEKLGSQYGFSVHKTDVASPNGIDKALTSLPAGIDTLFVTESPILHLVLDNIMTYASKKEMPVISQIPGLCDQGALMTLEADPSEQGQLAGVHALQILSGQKAHTLPVRTPKKVSLIINLKVAHEEGLTVPFQVLGMATRVIK